MGLLTGTRSGDNNPTSTRLINTRNRSKWKKDLNVSQVEKSYTTRSKTKQINEINNPMDKNDMSLSNQVNVPKSTNISVKPDSKRTKFKTKTSIDASLNNVNVLFNNYTSSESNFANDESEQSMSLKIPTNSDNSLTMSHTRLEDNDLANNNIHLRRSDRIKQIKNKEIKKYLDDDDQINVMMNEMTNTKINNQDQSKENKDNYRHSAIEQHQKETKHKIDWENAQLIWTDNNPHKLLIKESLIIKAYEPELNRTTYSVPLYIYPNGIDREFLPRLNL